MSARERLLAHGSHRFRENSREAKLLNLVIELLLEQDDRLAGLEAVRPARVEQATANPGELR